MHQTTKTRLLTTLLLASAAQPLQSMDYAYNILYGTGVAVISGVIVVTMGEIAIAVEYCLRDNKLHRRRTFDNMLNRQLFDVARNNNLDEVKSLVKQGADINTRDDHYTPLGAAILADRPQVVDYFLEQGVNLDGSHGRDYVRIALISGYPFHKLVEHGAPINIKSTDAENAPIHSCVLWNDLVNTKQFIEYGADITIENKYQKTPIDIAKEMSNLEIVDYLQNTRNYLINRIILTKKNVTMPNYGLLALRTFNPCDISLLRGDSSVDLPHFIKVWQWHKKEHFKSDIKSSLREMIWIDLDNKDTTIDTLEQNIVKINESYKVILCYNLYRKVLPRAQSKPTSVDIYCSFY